MVKGPLKLYGFNDLLPNEVSRAIRAHRDRAGRSIAISIHSQESRQRRALGYPELGKLPSKAHDADTRK